MVDFDIVICYGPMDQNKIHKMIEYTKKNVIGYRNIYIVSYDRSLLIEGCITVDENTFGFNPVVIKYLGNNERNGWYLQQLIKLYASFAIKDLLDNYLVIDTDTFFLKPTHFFDEDGRPLYNIGTEYWFPYFKHMEKMHPLLKRYDERISGITHHMVFQKNKLQNLFEMVERMHPGKLFYEIFLESVDPRFALTSGASEYEIYFNYLQCFCKEYFNIRPLKWSNVKIENLEKAIEMNYDYVSCHHYL